MREPPEARDHIAMAYRVFNITIEGIPLLLRHIRRQRGEEFDAAHLHFNRCGMFQRQIAEHSLDAAQVAVAAACDQIERQLQRARIVGKSLRRIAVDVPWELVEQQDQRQLSARSDGPVVVLAGCCGIDPCCKTRTHVGINRRILAPPQLALALSDGVVVSVPVPNQKVSTDSASWESDGEGMEVS